jgi:uncharacterized membrane protein YgcG
MIRNPYGPDELDRTDAALDEVAEQLQAYSSDESSAAPVDLAARIHAAVDAAPDPAVGWWTRLVGPWSTPARGFAAAAVVAAAVIAALVVGDLADLVRNPGSVGTTPSPPAIVSPSPSPTSSPSPSPTPSPSPSSAVTPTQSPPAGTPAPSPSDDHGGGTETPKPSGSDNSGPGGGGNSGPGGGGSSGSDD